MEVLTLLNRVIQSIPNVIANVKNFALTTLGFSEATYSIVAFVLAVIGAYAFMKQFITGTLWVKISTILNLLLLSLIIYLILNPTFIGTL